MAVISPTITITTPALQISTGPLGVSYASILNMLEGSWAFVADIIYYRPKNFSQFAYPLSYSHFEINANYVADMITTFTDPMDFLPVQFVQCKDRKMIFDGQGTLNLKVLPHEQIQLYFIGTEMYVTYALAGIHPDNFKNLENKMGRPDFFKDYVIEI